MPEEIINPASCGKSVGDFKNMQVHIPSRRSGKTLAKLQTAVKVATEFDQLLGELTHKLIDFSVDAGRMDEVGELLERVAFQRGAGRFHLQQAIS